MDDGDKLNLYLDNVIITKGNDEFKIPLSDLGIIVLDGMHTSITTRLLSACSKYNVVMIICDNKHLPTGYYMPLNQHSRSVKMLYKQVGWNKDKKDKIWMEIIKSKIQNQNEVLFFLTKNKSKFELIKGYIDNVELGDKTNREGHAAKVYFNTIFGTEFYRGKDCIENAMLNYGYAIIRAYIGRAIVGYGYNPSLGIFHRSEYNAFCLADDILEIFRPVVDLYSMLYIFENSDNEFLTQDIRAYLIDILSKRFKYKGHYQKLSTIIDKVVLQTISLLDPEYQKNDNFDNFKILTGEGIRR